jgi:hypothetical protein
MACSKLLFVGTTYKNATLKPSYKKLMIFPHILGIFLNNVFDENAFKT